MATLIIEITLPENYKQIVNAAEYASRNRLPDATIVSAHAAACAAVNRAPLAGRLDSDDAVGTYREGEACGKIWIRDEDHAPPVATWRIEP